MSTSRPRADHRRARVRTPLRLGGGPAFHESSSTFSVSVRYRPSHRVMKTGTPMCCSSTAASVSYSPTLQPCSASSSQVCELGELRSTREFITALIARELREEGCPVGTFGDLGSEALVVAKTVDRSVLGCMNDMALHCELAVGESGGLARLDDAHSTAGCGATSTVLGSTNVRSMS